MRWQPENPANENLNNIIRLRVDECVGDFDAINNSVKTESIPFHSNYIRIMCECTLFGLDFVL